MRRLLALLGLTPLLVVTDHATAAGAQTEEDRRAEIVFDIGDFDAELGDWTIDAVEVAGELTESEPFLVELVDEDGIVVWSGTADFTAPSTRIAVDRVVPVRVVVEARLAQGLPVEVAAPEASTPVDQGVPDPVVPDQEATDAPPAQTPPPDVAVDVVQQTQAQVLSEGAGGGGSGELALSLILAMFFLAILFRTPLPAAVGERWIK